MVTSNHIHLLVYDNNGRDVIPKSIQLIAARTGQEYNIRKQRKGAFWQDRYHATAIEKNTHLNRCLVYIDLNMIRAGVVDHPKRWPFCGYNEIQEPPSRYRIIDLDNLVGLMGFADLHNFQLAHKNWIEASLQMDESKRESQLTESLAVGSKTFIEKVKSDLEFKAKGRSITGSNGVYRFRENDSHFGNTSIPGFEPVAGADSEITNTFFWDEISLTIHLTIKMGRLSFIYCHIFQTSYIFIVA